jgi:hypothetical protein
MSERSHWEKEQAKGAPERRQRRPPRCPRLATVIEASILHSDTDTALPARGRIAARFRYRSHADCGEDPHPGAFLVLLGTHQRHRQRAHGSLSSGLPPAAEESVKLRVEPWGLARLHGRASVTPSGRALARALWSRPPHGRGFNARLPFCSLGMGPSPPQRVRTETTQPPDQAGAFINSVSPARSLRK